MIPAGVRRMIWALAGAVIEFETDATGNVTGLVLVQNGVRRRATKAK